jgi:thiamine-monophosphate kinase
MARWARHFGCPLVGGDIAIGGALVLSVTAVGAPHPARGPVLRSGTRPGDDLYVTGSLGGSFNRATGLGRHLTFEPRLAESRWLCDALGPALHSMMDLSDGLGRDAARMAAASGVRLVIDAAVIPRSPGVSDWRQAASNGEDYELLFTAPADAPVPAACPATGTPVTRIGVAAAGSGCVIVDGGRETDASELGWEHGRD